MHIVPTHITRNSLPHTADEIFNHLRVYAPPGETHLEADLITNIYKSALQWVESRTRRFLSTTDLQFEFTTWSRALHTSWYVWLDTDTLDFQYTDTDGNLKSYTDITFTDQCFSVGHEPLDRKPASPIKLQFTSRPYLRDDLRNAVLLLTAQWYENRGDQNIRGTPHWIDSICGLHSYQSL